MAGKKLGKTKMVIEEELKKIPKRTIGEVFQEDDIPRQYQVGAKTKKSKTSSSNTNPEYKKKLLEVACSQTEARKQRHSNLFKALSESTAQVKEDFNAMRENHQKLEKLAAAYNKCTQQALDEYEHNLKILKKIKVLCQTEYDEMESDQLTAFENLLDKVEDDIKKMEDKLVTETKQSRWESLRRSIFNAIQNDL